RRVSAGESGNAERATGMPNSPARERYRTTSSLRGMRGARRAASALMKFSWAECTARMQRKKDINSKHPERAHGRNLRVWRFTAGFGKMLSGLGNHRRNKNMSIAVGQTAPDFTLPNQEKKEVKLSDYAGKKNVVLVWYPL